MTASDVAPEARVNKIAAKHAAARLRECLDETRTHLRVGAWRGDPVDGVELIGHARDLHGTVCTCCQRRGA